MKKRRRLLKGWKLYVVTILTYPFFFGLLWVQQMLRAKRFNNTWHYSHMNVSLKEIAIFAGIAVASLTASVVYSDLRQQ
jgi:hypothetical protein